MSLTKNSTTPVRRTVGLLVIFSLLALVLSLYFLKYVPEQKADFNNRAFVELQQIKTALTGRNDAYKKVVENYAAAPIFSSTSTHQTNSPHLRMAGEDKTLQKVQCSVSTDTNGNYVLSYTTQKVSFQKRLDSVLTPMLSSYNDIFDNYFIIRDTGRGEIIFNSGQLSLDYFVNTDTLLKKSDGFSLLNVHDVKIEGNNYKLFLYPFKLCDDRIILAALINNSNYTKSYESIPVELITISAVLLLLLLLAIPLLKIYIIGSRERITSFDLRMIIGSYLFTPFLLFFLLTWFFVGTTQTASDKTSLQNLENQIKDSLYHEIHVACKQLEVYDEQYRHIQLPPLGEPLYKAVGAPAYQQRALGQDQYLHPFVYPQMDNVFWIDSAGKWVGRWGFKKFNNLPLISVADRPYFQDMLDGNVLVLNTKYGSDSFCIQPTLSKLEGSYVVNILIKSGGTPGVKRDSHSPITLGLSSEMYSVCDPVVPLSYGFSIIDNSGLIQFDSRSGRSLLANIFTEIRDNDPIRQSVIYRQERFFSHQTLRGHPVALLVKPLPGLPYTAIAYYELSNDEEFQLHVLGLSSFFTACTILLLILSAYLNEWSRLGATLLRIPQVGFEWLRPTIAKQNYYSYLQKTIWLLMAVFVGLWTLVETSSLHRYEFSLFLLSSLLPFYLAIYYFLLRQKQNGDPDRTPLAAIATPVLMILLAQTYIFPSDLNPINKFIFLAAQLLLIAIGFLCLYQYHPCSNLGKEGPVTIIATYVRTVMTALVSVIVIPAIGVFCFFFKEEMKTRVKEEKLSMAKSIDSRRAALLQRFHDYAFHPSDGSPQGDWDRTFRRELEFRNGIYFTDHTITDLLPPPSGKPSAHSPKFYYELRNLIFPTNKTLLSWGSNAETAGDESWFFHHEKDSDMLTYKYIGMNLYRDSIQLPLSRVSRTPAIGMALAEMSRLGASGILLLCLSVLVLIVIGYYLTYSLATRIFFPQLLVLYRKQEADLSEPCQWPACLLIGPALKKALSNAETRSEAAALLRKYELDGDNKTLSIQTQFEDTYDSLWNDLDEREKFILYDFAIDSLANFKSGLPIYTLLHSGVLYVDPQFQLRIMTRSFHNYVLDQGDTKVIVDQLKKAHEQGSWQSFRIPLFLLLSAAGIFVFLTQDAIYQKMTGLLTSIGSLVPLISQFFNKSDK